MTSTDRPTTGRHRRDADVIVVGARCAGAATAMLLARRGHRVTLVDRATFPSDTLSTHALSRGGVVQLARWGLLDDVLAAGTPAVRRTRFFHRGEVTERVVKDRAGVDLLVAPRRTVLDTLLVDAAVAAGAELRVGTPVLGPIWSDDRVGGVATQDGEGRRRDLTARVVIGADGLRSRFARAVDARFLDCRPALGATHYAYVAGLPDDDVLDQKLAALRAQASQTSALVEAFGEATYRTWYGRETFTDGARHLAPPSQKVQEILGRSS